MRGARGVGGRLWGGLLAALLAVPIVVAASGPAQAAVVPLFPDLKTLTPRELRFDRADISPNLSGVFDNVLRFSNDTYNAGEGPLILDATIDPSTLQGAATQRVMNSDGTFTDYPLNSDIYWHAAHSHYHLDHWGDYQLWTKATYDAWIASGRTTGAPIYEGAKTTSCVTDEEFVISVPNAVYPGPYGMGGCDAGANNQIHMGLAPGWGDTYDWYRQLQWIDLGQNTLGNGTYVLRSVADPTNILYESANKADSVRESVASNETQTTFVVSGGTIQDSDPPTGTVTINHVDKVTTAPNVSVDVVGRDDVSEPNQFRLSNDGITFQTFSYTSSGSFPTTVAWNLADAATGGTSTNGIHTVYAQVHDNSGKWGPTFTDTIDLESGGGPPPPPPPSGPYAQVVVADGPGGYWRLNETSGTTAADSIGSSPGVYNNGVTLGQPSLLASDPDFAASFPGTNQSVGIASTGTISPATTVSVEAWIKPASIPAAGAFASIVSKTESYALQFNGPQLEFAIMQNGNRQRLDAAAGATVAGGTYHVVGTYDGTTQRLYINGTLAVSRAQTGAITTNTNNLYIGSWDGTKEFFNGTIDEPAVYPIVLSDAQITNHYSAGITPTPPPVSAQLSISRSGTGNGTVTSTPAGITCGTTCSASFNSGTNVTLTATPVAGSTFTGWSGGGCSGTSTCAFNLNANTSINANFAAVPAPTLTVTVTVTRSGAGSGTVTSAPAGITCGTTCSASFTSGTSVRLTAAPVAGSTFTGWSGGGCSGTSTCAFNLNANTSINANFARVPMSVLKVSRRGYGTVRSSPAGIICGAACSRAFSSGTSVRLDAAARSGWIFTGWSGGRCRGKGACKVTLRAGTNVTATFTRRSVASHAPARPAFAPGSALARTVPVGTNAPGAAAFDSGLGRTYVTRTTGRGPAAKRGVTVIDTRSSRVIAQITTGGSGPTSNSIAVNPATHLVYVTTAIFDPRGVHGSLTVIDGRTNKIVRSIATGPGPKAVAVNPNTNRVYVTEQTGTNGGEAVAVIDGTSAEIIATIPIGSYERYYDNPHGLAVNPNTNTVYATNPLQGTVYTIDGNTNTIRHAIGIGGSPTAITVNLRTDTVYVTGARTVTAISGRSGAVTNSIVLASRSRAITFDSSRHVTYPTTDPGDILAINETTGQRSVASSDNNFSVFADDRGTVRDCQKFCVTA